LPIALERHKAAEPQPKGKEERIIARRHEEHEEEVEDSCKCKSARVGKLKIGCACKLQHENSAIRLTLFQKEV